MVGGWPVDRFCLLTFNFVLFTQEMGNVTELFRLGGRVAGQVQVTYWVSAAGSMKLGLLQHRCGYVCRNSG